MKLIEDLVYALLKWRVGREFSGGIPAPELPEGSWTHDQICYHAELCFERGLVQSHSHVLSGTGRETRRLKCRIGALTRAGHEELERMRIARPQSLFLGRSGREKPPDFVSVFYLKNGHKNDHDRRLTARYRAIVQDFSIIAFSCVSGVR